MRDYVQRDMLDVCEGEISEKKVKTPSSENLFKIEKNSPQLDKERKEHFHTMVAKGLFLCKRGRLDVAPTIAFLCTRVKEPTVQDWNKLARMMTFLCHAKNDMLVLQCDGTGVIKWHVDASFAVHEDCKSHTGATMTLGKGAIISTSTKQKINTRSSTEAEVVAFDDVAAKILWAKMFLEEQGYEIKENIVFQDNLSAMQLEKNGLASAGKRSRHLNVRLFFMTDLIKRKELEVKCCPTEEMDADYMTKPTQGQTFVKFRNRMLHIE